MVIARMARPHQLPSISHPRVRHTRRISTKLTNGIIMPMDFSASVIQRAHSADAVDEMVDTPRIARTAANPAACAGESLAARDVRVWLTSAAGRVDIGTDF